MNTILYITCILLGTLNSIKSDDWEVCKERHDLYESVINGFYSQAVDTIKSMTQAESEMIVRSVVNDLLEENHRNLLNFAFKLWELGQIRIVLKCFPPSFKLLFNQDLVQIVNLEQNRAITSSSLIVTAEPRTPSSEFRTRWVLVPYWSSNAVQFKIKRAGLSLYLALRTDTTGDTNVELVENSIKHDTVWTIEPIYKNNQTVYIIIHTKYGKSLKVGNSNDLYYKSAKSTYDCNFGGWTILESDSRISCEDDSHINQSLLEALEEKGSFEQAIKKLRELHEKNGGGKIKNIFDKILSKRHNKFMKFVAYAWHNGMSDVLSLYVPEAIKLILNKEEVKLIDYKYGLPLKLDLITVDGDRQAWGSNISIAEERKLWKFEYSTDTQRFKIINVENSMYLKIEVDDSPKKKAWGNNLNIWNSRFNHLLNVFKHNGEVLFEINNEQSNRFLTLEDIDAEGGDRAAVVLWEVDTEDPLRFAWKITK